MGDTPSLLYRLDNADDNNPGASSWGGTFTKTGHGPSYWTDKTDSGSALGGYHGAKTAQKHQDTYYKDFAARLDRAKSSNPDAGSNPDKDPAKPAPGDGGGDGNGGSSSLQAVDDTSWKTDVNATMWQNARYLTWNDKGGVGELTVTSVASKSAAGGSVTFSNDGTIRFNPKAGWKGKDRGERTEGGRVGKGGESKG